MEAKTSPAAANPSLTARPCRRAAQKARAPPTGVPAAALVPTRPAGASAGASGPRLVLGCRGMARLASHLGRRQSLAGAVCHVARCGAVLQRWCDLAPAGGGGCGGLSGGQRQPLVTDGTDPPSRESAVSNARAGGRPDSPAGRPAALSAAR